MSDVFSRRHVHHYPKDLKLIRAVSLQELSDWFVQQFEGLPQFQERARDLKDLREILSPIFKEIREDDRVWICQSKQRGPLLGHEGVALVRNEQPVIYIRVIQY